MTVSLQASTLIGNATLEEAEDILTHRNPACDVLLQVGALAVHAVIPSDIALQNLQEPGDQRRSIYARSPDLVHQDFQPPQPGDPHHLRHEMRGPTQHDHAVNADRKLLQPS
ncbi:hypothetical protein BKG82_27610 [Mycobacteroides chelonae]|uniref:Uncharacterized protein n=1 Tax=Mycobacteroides chelonae TaxID=1774 RepID=A0A1S1LHW0_MYCCH|nr:hypothetical protein [Mycobacteroides chelonae]OHU47379.1 hypothetical protein BKG82_27610 [Mycobacteroides chelonae]